MRTLMILTLVMAFAATAFAQNGIQADFEAGANNGAWAVGPVDVVDAAGGTPDGWLHTGSYETYAPIFHSGYNAEGWTGDFAAMGVTSFHGDFQTVATTNNWFSDYPTSLVLRNSFGTPNDIEDDVYLYTDPWSNFAPNGGTGWTNYSFNIPSDFVGAPGETPSGWFGGSYQNTTQMPSDITWQEVISDINVIEIHFLAPGFSAQFQTYEMGADNLTLEYDQGAVATEKSSFGNLKALYR